LSSCYLLCHKLRNCHNSTKCKISCFINFHCICYYGTRPLGTPAAEVDSTGYALYLVDVYGNKELIYRDPAISCFMPIPLRSRTRPPILREQIDLARDYATCTLSDVTHGCDGIEPEQVGYLRIAEPIGWPYDNRYGGHRYVEDHNCQEPTGEQKIVDESWTPVRILGDVPIAPDGSVHVQIALTVPGCPLKNTIREDVAEAARTIGGGGRPNPEVTLVGGKAPENLLDALEQAGISIFLAGVCLTTIPHLLTWVFGLYLLKLNPVLLMGAMTGAGTCTAAMNSVKEDSQSTVPVIGYTVPYAIGNVLLTVWGALIVSII